MSYDKSVQFLGARYPNIFLRAHQYHNVEILDTGLDGGKSISYSSLRLV